MTNVKLTVFIFPLAVSISTLSAQALNPVNGTAYSVEFVEWIINGEDKLSSMQSNVRSSTITFNSDNVVVNFGNNLYKAAYTFFPNGSCEVAIKALFIQRTVSGSGRIERSGRDFTLYLSMRTEAGSEDIVTMIKGNIR